MKSSFLRLCLFSVALACCQTASARSSSGSIFVAWDPNPEAEVVGYKIHYGTVSGEYQETVDVGLSTSAELVTLEPQRLHYCAVTAYDAQGLESDYSEELPVVYYPNSAGSDSPGGGIIILNPDLGTIFSNGGSPTASSLQTKTLSLDFSANEGTYSLWARVRYPASPSALPVALDDSPSGSLSLPSNAASIASGSQPDLTWSRLVSSAGNPATFGLSQGTHSLKISNIVEGIEIDRIVLSNNAFFTPSDAIRKSGDAVSIIKQPQAQIESLEGELVVLEVEVVSTGPTQYQWFKDGIALPEETRAALSITAIEPEQAGSYTALITSGQASSATGRSSVIVVQTPFEVTSMLVGSGNSIQFEVLGKIGSVISVYGSVDLKNWSLVSVEYNETGTITVSDPEIADHPKRFYRLEAP
ncbi:fibronectin type III domain-containing protein [Haloferula sp.]|uniref:fibronectin type III domain-containing protein n=1 Tax=Haloferula sp. TaxID=2497595 RepID=UPI003C761D34